MSGSTIRNKKRKLGIIDPPQSFMRKYKPPRKSSQYKAIKDPKIWNNEEWFRKMHEKGLGKRTIARLIGRSMPLVLTKLRKYGIESDHSHTSSHACCNGEWLAFHYCTRPDYLEWCKDNNIKPAAGGLALTITQMAETTDVSYYTIINWLSKFGIYIRGISESMTVTANYRKHESNIMEIGEVENQEEAR